MPREPFVDIHCHLLPAIDDGAKTLDESLAMARMAVQEGIATVIVTPHQLGNFAHNTGAAIRRRAAKIQAVLDDERVPLRLLPGADVRIEADMLDKLKTGEVLTLGDHGKHVLLELPHELYFPLEPVLENLRRAGMVGVLSHPERNQGLLSQPHLLAPLVQRGCLMQITAGSLAGTFGPKSQQLAEQMLAEGLVHFVATDAHGIKARRPLMRRAHDRVVELCGEQVANAVCRTNPAAVASGTDVFIGKRPRLQRKKFGLFSRKQIAA